MDKVFSTEYLTVSSFIFCWAKLQPVYKQMITAA